MPARRVLVAALLCVLRVVLCLLLLRAALCLLCLLAGQLLLKLLPGPRCRLPPLGLSRGWKLLPEAVE